MNSFPPRASFGGLLIAAVVSTGFPLSAQSLATEIVVEGLERPVAITSPPADSRLFVCEQHSGKIRIVRDGSLLAAPFLDLGGQVSTTGEQGLLGLAFHPDYADNGYFFVNYTDLGDTTRVVRYRVSSDPDVADAASAEEVLSQPQPQINHNGGDLAFSPIDGYLYIGLGDGGGAGDPDCNAQDPTTWLGKMLRIDVDELPYRIPADNPFAGSPNLAPEIWALGLRNPWRYSFDRLTGDLYIGDVGQGAREEISFGPALEGGLNYGWKVLEGFLCFGDENCSQTPAPCQAPIYTDPIFEYTHVGFFGPCAVIGGSVYRGCAIPELQGTYFLADFCSANVWSFRYADGALADFANRTLELQPPGSGLTSLTTFGEDANGELYLAGLNGQLLRIVRGDGGPLEDCDGDGVEDGCQLAEPAADLDGDGTLDRCQELSADVPSISVAGGGAQAFSLHAGSAFAGSTYFLIGTLSGTEPGFPYEGFQVPLNPDTYTLITTSNPNLPPLANSLATLDGAGEASASFSVVPAALPPALVGLTLHHAYAVLDPSFAAQLVSNPVSLELEP